MAVTCSIDGSPPRHTKLPLIIWALQGKYDKAESLHKRALEIVEAKLGCDHPNVATALGNMAALLYSKVRNAGLHLLICQNFKFLPIFLHLRWARKHQAWESREFISQPLP